jgi:hypothetical protein
MKIFCLAVVGALLSACSVSPSPNIVAGPSPSNPASPVKPVRYTPVTAGTVDFRPVEPKPWSEQNRKVAPGAEGGQ